MPPRKGIHPHPNSIANLNRSGGQPRYEEPKKQRNIQVTPTGWEGIRAIAIQRGLSLNELIEQIGRGVIPLADPLESRTTDSETNADRQVC